MLGSPGLWQNAMEVVRIAHNLCWGLPAEAFRLTMKRS